MNLETAKAQKYGAISNTLKILSEDHKRLRPDAFSSVTGLHGTKLSALLDVPRPTVYRESIPLPKKLLKRIIQLVIATDLVFVLLGNNLEETKVWVMAPNTHLFGDSPFEVILRGEGDSVITWLRERSGHTQGQAF